MWGGKGKLPWTNEVLIKPRDRHKVFQFLPGKPLPLPWIGSLVLPITLPAFLSSRTPLVTAGSLRESRPHSASLNMTLYLSPSTLNIDVY